MKVKVNFGEENRSVRSVCNVDDEPCNLIKLIEALSWSLNRRRIGGGEGEIESL